MNKEEIEVLGWKYETFFNNRCIYSLGIGTIFEHNGNIGIIYKHELIYCNLSVDELKEYTNIIKTLNKIEEAPDKYTYLEALNVFKREAEFVQKMLVRVKE